MNCEEICLDDRFRVFKVNHLKIPFVKKVGLDLAAKYMLLLMNSFGKKSKNRNVFVDEVKNNSMVTNMRNTMKHFSERKESFCVCNFRGREKEFPHVKIGYANAAMLFLTFSFQYCMMLVFSLLFARKEVKRKMAELLISYMRKYISIVEQGKSKVHFYMMTDHNFFSTIVALSAKGKTSVIQHGLILDRSYYYPILADEFLAWGEESQKKLEGDSKVKVTGTYKFDLYAKAPENDDGSILYCVSILDNKLVKKKIDNLLKITKEAGLGFKVKTHPGSFYNVQMWKDMYAEEDIQFFQEESLLDIPFHTAVIENSTILLDMLYLKKNIVIYDSADGYFGQYADIVPCSESYEGIKEALSKERCDGFESTEQIIMEKELFGGQCTI